MLPHHSIEDNALHGRPLFSNELELGTAVFTFVEAVGGTVWLAFVVHGAGLLSGLGIEPIPILSMFIFDGGAAVGLVLLGVALFIEPLMGVQFAFRMGEPGAGV